MHLAHLLCTNFWYFYFKKGFEKYESPLLAKCVQQNAILLEHCHNIVGEPDLEKPHKNSLTEAYEAIRLAKLSISESFFLQSAQKAADGWHHVQSEARDAVYSEKSIYCFICEIMSFMIFLIYLVQMYNVQCLFILIFHSVCLKEYFRF